MIQLHWRTSSTACALYAAAAMATGRRLPGDRGGRELARPLARLRISLTEWELQPDAFLRGALPLTLQHSAMDDLARATLSRLGKTAQPLACVANLSEAVRTLESALLRNTPDLMNQLALRMGPLRAAWEARGPGLWKALRQILPEDSIPPSATANVLCVQPIFGGGGEAYAGEGVVTIEAVLANPHFQLPEVVRLGWLLAQSLVCVDEAEQSCSADLVTSVLKAAEAVDLARCDPATIQLASHAWISKCESEDARSG